MDGRGHVEQCALGPLWEWRYRPRVDGEVPVLEAQRPHVDHAPSILHGVWERGREGEKRKNVRKGKREEGVEDWKEKEKKKEKKDTEATADKSCTSVML